VLNPWTIQQLAKAEHAKNLKKAEMIRRARQPGLVQRMPNRNLCFILKNLGRLLVSCGIFFQRRCNMISRVWYGWTTPANADAYESLLKSEIFVGIQNRQIRGYRGIQLFRRNLGDEVEFVTVMWFDSIEAVRAFAGEDYEKAVVPPKARTLLLRFDQRSQHYEVRAEMKN
jgi:heme-degrading monooxygenase HmoA